MKLEISFSLLKDILTKIIFFFIQPRVKNLKSEKVIMKDRYIFFFLFYMFSPFLRRVGRGLEGRQMRYTSARRYFAVAGSGPFQWE